LNAKQLFEFLKQMEFNGPIIFELTVEEAKSSISHLIESGVIL